MSNEPERDIEKVLKSYAKKRREDGGAPLEMHPATRRLLQSEVARQFQKECERSSRLDVFSRFWPRFALGGSIFFVLMMGLWMVLSEHNQPKVKMDMALRQERKLGLVNNENRPAKPKAAAETFASKVPSTPAIDTNFLAGRNKTTFTVTDGLSKPVPSSSSTDLAKNVVRENETLRRAAQTSAQKKIELSGATRDVDALKPAEEPAPLQAARNRDAAPAAPPAPVVAPITGLLAAADAGTVNFSWAAKGINTGITSFAYGGTLNTNLSLNGTSLESLPKVQVGSVASSQGTLFADAPASSTQFFRQLTVQNRSAARAKTEDTSSVLASFSFETTGDQVRVLDGDGSVYYGFYKADEAPKSGQMLFDTEQFKEKSEALADKKLSVRALSKDASGESTPIQTRYFRVAGTNLTLHEPILFTGSVTLSTNLLPQTLGFDRIQGRATGAAGTNGAIVQPLQSKLEGKVVIGETNQILINAAPVAPGK